ncbi:MAG: substrate-binding domain-containing protein [Bifidobacteriaceae bacterium]|nr:substrate-binding domain-containing protein [Bifidobacteriaceae bacterium]
MVFDVQSAAESSDVLESLPALRRLDGVIVMSVPVAEGIAAALKKGGLPAVFVDWAAPGFPSVTCDDELAAAAHLAAARLALRVPDQLGIVGFDDGVTAQALQLTTVRQPLRQTGEWAFRTLTAMIEDPTLAAPSLTFPVALVRRQSA